MVIVDVNVDVATAAVAIQSHCQMAKPCNLDGKNTCSKGAMRDGGAAEFALTNPNRGNGSVAKGSFGDKDSPGQLS